MKIYGINPIKEALRITPPIIERIFIARNICGDTAEIEQGAKRLKIPVEYKEKTYLKTLLGEESHQGIVGICREFGYTPFDDIVTEMAMKEIALLLVLDEITDPQNLGAAIRSAHCCGANGIIIPEKRSCPVTPSVIKASAGAVFFTKIARVTNLAKTIDTLKENGFWIYGSVATGGEDIRHMSFTDKTAMVMGSEGTGMRKLVTEKCDFLVSIPMMGQVDSLNVSVATGIAVHEIQSWFHKKAI
ncbi:MAG: 23S rRNA (guanosine(2251)-2'-O)-methyltransferase RlmB [Deltaproteobacteria bacterium]